MRVRGGFILVAALWLIVALSAVGLDAALRSQARRAPAMNRLDDARAREAALAGTEYARSRLTAVLREYQDEIRAATRRQREQGRRSRELFSLVGSVDPWRAPDELIVREQALGDAQFTVDAHDTGAALNIAVTTEDMLRDFLSQGLRLDFAQADRLTQAILDWQDEDDLPRVNGGERAEYISAGAAVLPPNQPIVHIDELRHVMGMTPELLELMRPYITVIGSGRINVNAAPEPVLVAVPTITPMVARAIIQLRGAGRYPRDQPSLRQMLGRIYRSEGRDQIEFNRRATFTTNEIEIVAAGRTEGSPVVSTVRSVVARSDNGAVVVWRRIE